MLCVPEWKKRVVNGKMGQDQGRGPCRVEEDLSCGYIVSGVHESRSQRRKASCLGLYAWSMLPHLRDTTQDGSSCLD